MPDTPPKTYKKTYKILGICAILYLLSQILFLINIQFPIGYNFDEFHYVPAAKQFLKFEEPRNIEHPPLGKTLMAASIAIWGDRPIGWRFGSTVFGSLTLVGMFLWGLALFRNLPIALWIAAITVVNQLLYVQARIGMLDTYMFGFIVWGVAAFTASWDAELQPPAVRRYWVFAGVMFGLATACKWFAVVPWFSCLGIVLGVRLLQKWRVRFPESHPDDWYSPGLWYGVKMTTAITWLLALPVLVYYLNFVPFLFMSKTPYTTLWDLITLQGTMYDEQLRVVNSHPYMSHWNDWPLMRRPIWYAFDKEGSGASEMVRGVLLLGNPLIMWTGLLALLACLWGWLITRGRDAFIIIFFYFVFYGSWILIPRKISFYYYYYPAGMTLSLALAYVFYHLERASPGKLPWARWIYFAGALGLFIYFFPILAALRIPAGAFMHWMWFHRPGWNWI